MAQVLFNVLCDAGWNRTLAEGLKGRCEHGLGRLAWNYYTFFQIDSCCKTLELVTGDFPNVILALMTLGLWTIIHNGSIPNCDISLFHRRQLDDTNRVQ